MGSGESVKMSEKCRHELIPEAGIIEEDVRRIAENAEEKAAREIWREISRKVEREKADGKEAGSGTVEIKSTVDIAGCEEIHYWACYGPEDSERRDCVEWMIGKYGLKMRLYFAVDGEAFAVALPVFRIYPELFPKKEDPVKIRYGPCKCLETVIGLLNATAAENSVSLRCELVGYWVYLVRPDEKNGERRADHVEETVFPDVLARHRFERDIPGFDHRTGRDGEGRPVEFYPRIRIRYEFGMRSGTEE